MKHSAILWPDHAIGKRESRAIREAHNALYNDYHEALAALRALRPILDKVWAHDGDVFGVLNNAATDADSALDAAIAKAEGKA